jgi:hypothetical protein
LGSASDAYDGDRSCSIVTDASESPGTEVVDACASRPSVDGTRDVPGDGAVSLLGGSARRTQCFVRAIAKHIQIRCSGIDGARIRLR